MFQQQRSKEFIQPLFAVTDPEKANDLLKKYRGIMFPEQKYDEMKYYRQSAAFFDRVRDVNLTAKVVQ